MKTSEEIVREIDRRIADAEREMREYMRTGFNYLATHEQGKRDALRAVRDLIAGERGTQ